MLQVNIRGVNWKYADLSKYDFQQCYAGLTTSQLLVIQLMLCILAAITGMLAGVTGIGATGLLKPSNIDKFTLLPGIVLVTISLLGMILVVRKGFAAFLGFSASAFCLFAIFFLLTSKSWFWINFWGNLFIFTAITTIPQLIALWLGGVVSTADRSLPRSAWIVLTLSGLAGMAGNLVLIKFIDPEIDIDWLDGVLSLNILLACPIIGNCAARTKSSFPGILQLAIALSSIRGTSFRGANLTEANFAHANLRQTDFRDANLTRVYWLKARGLEFSRLDNTYLAHPQIRQLVTTLNGQRQNFNSLNLGRTNLQGANLNHASLVDANLEQASLCNADLSEANLQQVQFDRADLRGANLRNSILVRTILTNANLSQTDLTGACIKDWSFNDQTDLTGVRCDYVYREFENNQPTDRYPSDRDFQPGEFESLFQKLTNAVELVFQDQIDWRALSFTFEKFRLEDDGMGLELKGIEQRGDYWIVKVTHGEGVSKQQVEQQVQSTYEDLRSIMEVKDKQINRLLGIVETQTEAMQRQAEALTNFSQQPFGNHFLISGSTITNLAGSGQIEYREAAHGVRSLITNQIDPNSNLQELLGQLKHQNVATTSATQRDLIQQVLLSEADRDPVLKQFLLKKGQHILDRLPDGEFKIAIRNAISLIRND